MPLLSVTSYKTLLIILDALIECVEQSIQPPVNVVSLLLVPLSHISPVSSSIHHHNDIDGRSEENTTSFTCPTTTITTNNNYNNNNNNKM